METFRCRPGGKKYTFGYHRAEALGALFTVVIIWYVTGVLVYLAAHRIAYGEFEVDPVPMMVVAGSAVLFNIVLGFVLHGVPHGHSHGGGGGGRAHRDPESFEEKFGLRSCYIGKKVEYTVTRKTVYHGVVE